MEIVVIPPLWWRSEPKRWNLCLCPNTHGPERVSVQLVNERLMGAEGTKMDEDFVKKEKVKAWTRGHCAHTASSSCSALTCVSLSVRVLQWFTLCCWSCPPKPHSSSNQTQVGKCTNRQLMLLKLWDIFKMLKWNMHCGEGSELCEIYQRYVRRTTVTNAAATSRYPDAAYRAKLSMLNTVSRIRGQGKAAGYPQTEGILGECMLHHGLQLGAASEFGTIETTCSTKAR